VVNENSMYFWYNYGGGGGGEVPNVPNLPTGSTIGVVWHNAILMY